MSAPKPLTAEEELARLKAQAKERRDRWRANHPHAAAAASRREEAIRNAALRTMCEAFPDEYAAAIAAVRAEGVTGQRIYSQARRIVRDAHRDEYRAARAIARAELDEA